MLDAGLHSLLVEEAGNVSTFAALPKSELCQEISTITSIEISGLSGSLLYHDASGGSDGLEVVPG
jgi:hypothetical protein